MIDSTEREVPADVRARITETVRDGMSDGERRRNWVPIAAGVAALAIVSTATVVFLHDPLGGAPAPATRPTPTQTPFVQDGKLDGKPTADDLDRCWQALGQKGRQRGFPDRAHWKPVVRDASGGVNTTAVNAGGKNFFCLTTATAVTVTDPDAVVAALPGTTIRVALIDDMGIVAGVAHQRRQFVLDTGGNSGMPANHQFDGPFIMHADPRRNLASSARIGPDANNLDVPFLRIPKPPAAAVSFIDRPLPAPDRTSAEGKRLGACLDAAGWPKSFADQWQPGAVVAHGPDYAQLAVNGSVYGSCDRLNSGTVVAGCWFFPGGPLPASNVPMELVDSVINSGTNSQYPITGGSVDARAKSMSALLSDGSQRSVAVLNGTWIVQLPGGGNQDTTNSKPTATIKSVTVRDGQGTVLYEGPVVKP